MKNSKDKRKYKNFRSNVSVKFSIKYKNNKKTTAISL